jgi:nucleoid-associated protein YgaU
MARETKIGLLVGMSFILCFAIILSRGTEPIHPPEPNATGFAVRTESAEPEAGTTATAGRLAPADPVRSTLPPRRRQAKAATGHARGGTIADANPHAVRDPRSVQTTRDEVRPAMPLDERFTTRSGPIPAPRTTGQPIPQSHRALADAGRIDRPYGDAPTLSDTGLPSGPGAGVVMPSLRSDHPRQQTWTGRTGRSRPRASTAQPSYEPSPGGRPPTQQASPQDVARPKPSLTATEPAGTPAAPVGSQTVETIGTHSVAAGENLTRIARRYYGADDPAVIAALFEANRDRMNSADHLVAGWKLRLPRIDGYPEALHPRPAANASVARDSNRPADTQASKGTEVTNDTPSAPSAEPSRRRRARPSAGRTYQVQPGDRLSEIAVTHYGTARPAVIAAIVGANTDQISDADTIRVGQRLTLPDIPGIPSGPTEGATPIAALPEPKRMTASASSSQATGRDRAGDDGEAMGTSLGRRGIDWEWYELQPGDMYSRLAARYLGSARRWREIAEMNEDIFADPGQLRSGVKIRLPLPVVASRATESRR